MPETVLLFPADEKTNKRFYLEQDLSVECINKNKEQFLFSKKEICITHNIEDFEKQINDNSSLKTVLLIQNINNFYVIEKIHNSEKTNANYKEFTCSQKISYNHFLYQPLKNCLQKTVIISAIPGMGK